MKLFSYVVEHDTGRAPNPYFGLCTLCRCKFKESRKGHRNVVELAKPGDWVIGTGGSNQKRSAGRGRLVYAMRVEYKLTREEYYTGHFKAKKPLPNGSYEERHGDNEPPSNSVERHEQFVLISKKQFYYFGRNAIPIPHHKFPGLEKRGPGFKRKFDDAYVARVVRWITRKKTGRHGDPCMKEPLARRRSQACKSSC